MMRQMRENTKWIMMITAFAFVGLMVFQWGMDITGQGGGGLSGELGKVNGDAVYYEQYMAAYRNLYDQVQAGQEEPVGTVQNREIEDAAWDDVVNQMLVRQELARRGIRVTDDEIVQAARFSPPPEFRQNVAFQTDGRFDLQKYQEFISNPNVDEFLLLQLEGYYRDVIPRGKLLRQVSSGIYAPDAELWRLWQDQNEKVQIRFLALDPARRVSDDRVTISDSDVADYYDDNRDEFATPARATVKVSVIVKAPTAADTAATVERAGEIYQELVDGADFDEVAARESDDPGSAAQGGSLGTILRGQLFAELDEYVFSGPIGELSEPIESRAGYHIVEILSRDDDTAEARHILVTVGRTDDSEMRLLILADSLESLGEEQPLAEAAAAVGLEVQELDITEDFPFVAGVGQATEGAEWAFVEAEPGDVSPVFETRQAFYALELIAAEEAGYLPLEDASAAIRQTLISRERMRLSMEEGEDLVAQLRGGADFDEVAGGAEIDVNEPNPFSRAEFVPGLGRQNAATGTAFGLTEGDTSGAVETANNAFIIQLVARIPADSAAWEAQKEDQRVALVGLRGQQRLQLWMAGLRQNANIVDRREQVLQAQTDLVDAAQRLPMAF